MIRSVSFRAMNTLVQLAAEGQQAVTGIHATKQFIDDCEQRFSRFLPASELTELNRFAAEWFEISSDLMELLQLSLKYYEETNGIFDPTILPDLKRVGYDRSMDEILNNDRIVTTNASQRTLRPAFREVEFDLAENRVKLPRGMEIDLGGIAKGWIIDQAARKLHSYAEACAVSAGGDILFVGRPSDGLDWDVFMEDPRDPVQMLAELHIPTGAVATSSITKRTWIQGTQTRHHLIDPRTGEPAQIEWLSATVIAPEIITAEVYAKTILIGGPTELPNILKRRPDITCIVVQPNGQLMGSSNYKEFLYEFTTDSIVSTEHVH
jgi:FAD:protein FMN transferase